MPPSNAGTLSSSAPWMLRTIVRLYLIQPTQHDKRRFEEPAGKRDDEATYRTVEGRGLHRTLNTCAKREELSTQHMNSGSIWWHPTSHPPHESRRAYLTLRRHDNKHGEITLKNLIDLRKHTRSTPDDITRKCNNADNLTITSTATTRKNAAAAAATHETRRSGPHGYKTKPLQNRYQKTTRTNKSPTHPTP